MFILRAACCSPAVETPLFASGISLAANSCTLLSRFCSLFSAAKLVPSAYCVSGGGLNGRTEFALFRPAHHASAPLT